MSSWPHTSLPFLACFGLLKPCRSRWTTSPGSLCENYSSQESRQAAQPKLLGTLQQPQPYKPAMASHNCEYGTTATLSSAGSSGSCWVVVGLLGVVVHLTALPTVHSVRFFP